MVVDHPHDALAADRLDRLSEKRRGARPLQQVVVEFAAANPVADRAIEVRDDAPASLDRLIVERAALESGEGLECAAGRVVGQVELERGDDGRCNPARAELLAWERGAV